MTNEDFRKFAAEIQGIRDHLGEYETKCFLLMGSEQAQQIRGQLMALQMQLHATRMHALLVKEALVIPLGQIDGKKAA